MSVLTRARPRPAAGATRPPAPASRAELERLLGTPLPTGRRERAGAWLVALVITAFAALLRFWHLGHPHQLIFDETYYVKDAYTLFHHGVELAWPDKADRSFTSGTPGVYLHSAGYPVHPPVGKYMIALGEELFGIRSSFGWRFSSAVCGTAVVLMVCRIGRRLLGSTLLGATAGLLLAVDGLELVMSRTGILDIFLAFWTTAAFGLLLLDRDSSRRRLAAAVAAGRTGAPATPPRLWWRPWRLAAAVCLGLDCGVKWSGVDVTAGFLLMSVLWDVAARRRVGTRRWGWALAYDGLPAAVTTVPLAFAVYLASWTGWLATDDGHLRQWAQQNPGRGVLWLPPALRSLWEYHREMWQFHTTLDTPHPYMSNPWSWIVQGRPTSFYYEHPVRGQAGCHVKQCSEAITSLGDPVVWWTGTICLLVLLFGWLLRRDWRAGAIVMGIAAGWLPWFQYPHRTIFTFYAVIFSPFLVLGIAYALGLAAGGPGAPRARKTSAVVVGGAVVVGACAAAAFFWPVWTAQVVPYASWHARMWLQSWI